MVPGLEYCPIAICECGADLAWWRNAENFSMHIEHGFGEAVTDMPDGAYRRSGENPAMAWLREVHDRVRASVFGGDVQTGGPNALP